MISIEELLREQERFFELFERGAEHARDSVAALRRFTRKPPAQRSLADLAESRSRERETMARITEELCGGFVASLDRDDLEALSQAIYRIPKTVEKIAERILLAPGFLKDIDIARPLVMLEQAGDILLAMVQELRRGTDMRVVRERNARLQGIEGDTDKLVVALLGDLYNGEQDAIRIHFLKEVFELIENVTDRFRDAGNVISRMVLKNA